MGALQDKKEEVMPQCLVFYNQKRERKINEKDKGGGRRECTVQEAGGLSPLCPPHPPLHSPLLMGLIHMIFTVIVSKERMHFLPPVSISQRTTPKDHLQ